MSSAFLTKTDNICYCYGFSSLNHTISFITKPYYQMLLTNYQLAIIDYTITYHCQTMSSNSLPFNVINCQPYHHCHCQTLQLQRPNYQLPSHSHATCNQTNPELNSLTFFTVPCFKLQYNILLQNLQMKFINKMNYVRTTLSITVNIHND